MDTALQALLSYQFILFCLGLAAITYVLRLVVQFFVLDNPKLPGTRASALWKELLLPIAPVVNGALLGWLVKTSLYPEVVTGTAGRVFFGLVAGLLSGLVYRVVWGMIKSKLPSGVIGVVVSDSPPELTNEQLGKLTENVTSNAPVGTGTVPGLVITDGSVPPDTTVNKE